MFSFFRPDDNGSIASIVRTTLPVSRETDRPDQRVFDYYWPADASAIKSFARLLSDEGPARGLIGPREVDRIWQRHILNCVALSPLLTAGAQVADIGSGAGLPGLVLASARSDVSLTLVEPMLRRTSFLHEAIDVMGLRNTLVIRCRAEQLHGVRAFDAVTARAVAPLERLLQWCLPLVRPGGCVLAMKGSSAIQELSDTRPFLREWGETHQSGAVKADIVRVGQGVLRESTTVVRIVSPQC